MLWEKPVYYGLWMGGKIWMCSVFCSGIIFWVVISVIWFIYKFYI